MSTRLMVLGMLSRAAMHGYEIQKALEISRADVWADVLPGSIYHALKKMAAEGLLEIRATEQKGHRLRAVYAITDAGRDAFKQLLRKAWAEAPRTFPTQLFTALTFLEALPRNEVRAALEEQVRSLRAEIERWNAGERAKASHLPEYARLLFENGREHLEADLRLLMRLDALLQAES